MLINAINIAALNTGYTVLHNTAYDSYVPLSDRICTHTTSSGAQTVMTWLEDGGAGLVKKDGPTDYRGFGASTWAMINEEFNEGRFIPQSAIEDDTYGAFNPAIAQVGLLARAHPDMQTFKLLENGFVEKDYTDSAFFSLGKRHYKALGDNQYNLFDNLLTQQFHADSFAKAKTMMLSLKRPGTKPEHRYPYNRVIKLLVVHSPEITADVRKVLKATLVNQGETNVWMGEAESMECPFLSGPAWYLLNVGEYMKPIINQERIPLQFYTMTNPNQVNILTDGELRFKTRKRCKINYGAPQFAVGSTGVDP
jgi:phage major head subunit gpT-like protein